eukprot:TRINITY_DN4172_c0_g1_i1.p1 TRINITY_DN4172_c0_g1~~TRINITY_DN4172_c0_g1_i1.p1  ORF type:complete len:164 (-),score=0.17 TRINITY_DN4172_c0_g1_i1:64-555(-)
MFSLFQFSCVLIIGVCWAYPYTGFLQTLSFDDLNREAIDYIDFTFGNIEVDDIGCNILNSISSGLCLNKKAVSGKANVKQWPRVLNGNTLYFNMTSMSSLGIAAYDNAFTGYYLRYRIYIDQCSSSRTASDYHYEWQTANKGSGSMTYLQYKDVNILQLYSSC